MLAHCLTSLTTIGKNIQIGSLAGLGLLLFIFGTALRKRLPLNEDQPRPYPARTLDPERPKPSVGAFVTAGKMMAPGTRVSVSDPGLRAVQSRSSYPLA
jgi:hypothetical protein